MKEKLKILGGGGLDGSNPPQPPVCFFLWNSSLLNGLNPNLGNIVYSGYFSKLGEKKCLIRRKKILFQR